MFIFPHLTILTRSTLSWQPCSPTQYASHSSLRHGMEWEGWDSCIYKKPVCGKKWILSTTSTAHDGVLQTGLLTCAEHALTMPQRIWSSDKSNQMPFSIAFLPFMAEAHMLHFCCRKTESLQTFGWTCLTWCYSWYQVDEERQCGLRVSSTLWLVDSCCW